MPDKDNALVVREPINYAITEIPTKELVELIRENIDGDLSPNDLERLTVPPGGGKIWNLMTAEGEQNLQEIEGVIIAQKTTRVFWAGEFSGGGSPPDCFSDDGEIGIGNPGGPCETCPYAEFGSKATGGGRAQACKQNKLLFVVLPGEILPRVISVPPTSLKEARQYTLRMLSGRQPLYGATTKFTLEQATNADNIKYSKIKFSQGSILNDEDRAAMEAYAKQMAPFLKKVRSDDMRNVVVDLDNDNDDYGEPEASTEEELEPAD